VYVLVTGGAGYIGSHTAKALAGAGFEPVVYDNLSTGHRWAVRWGPFCEGDLLDAERLRTVIQEFRPVAAIHFAASAYVGESIQNPGKYFRNNVGTTINLVDAICAAGVNNIVLSSTCAVYGCPETVPIREDWSKVPVNPYGESKLFIERMLPWYAVAHGLRWGALRYFNASGADLDGEIGECHSPETDLIPLAIECALGKRSFLEVFGTDYETSDGTAVRDYIHVDDLADAHVRALGHLLSAGDNIALNLGTGRGYSVREIIEAVEEKSGKRVPVRYSPRRPGDPPELVADAERAETVLGWRPRHSSLSTIIESALNWHAGQISGSTRGRTLAAH
jgi:UDP-arabinose 4-epimerase